MARFWEIFTLIFILIAIFLFLSRGKETVSIINSIAGASIGGIKTLQGRG